MGMNGVLGCINLVPDKVSSGKSRCANYNEILIMWRKVIDMMKKGFEAMDSRLQIINVQMDQLNEILKHMKIDK